jgi:hypothetical protein
LTLNPIDQQYIPRLKHSFLIIWSSFQRVRRHALPQACPFFVYCIGSLIVHFSRPIICRHCHRRVLSLSTASARSSCTSHDPSSAVIATGVSFLRLLHRLAHRALLTTHHLPSLPQACPFFVYCIGASLAITMTSRRWRASPKRPRLWHIFERTAKMLVLGFIIKNGNIMAPGKGQWDLRTIRLVSVLSRLGLSCVCLCPPLLPPPPTHTHTHTHNTLQAKMTLFHIVRADWHALRGLRFCVQSQPNHSAPTVYVIFSANGLPL